MTGNDWLQALRDIHLPPPVSAWPPGVGWWVGAVVLLTALLLARAAVRRRSRRLRRLALLELEEVAQAFEARSDHEALARHLSGLLRRVALLRFEPTRVAGLYGEEWLGFLAATGRDAGHAERLAEGLWTALYAGSHYQPVDGDAECWLRATRRWIEANT